VLVRWVARAHVPATQVVHWSANKVTSGSSMASSALVMCLPVLRQIIPLYSLMLSTYYHGSSDKLEVSIYSVHIHCMLLPEKVLARSLYSTRSCNFVILVYIFTIHVQQVILSLSF